MTTGDSTVIPLPDPTRPSLLEGGAEGEGKPEPKDILDILYLYITREAVDKKGVTMEDEYEGCYCEVCFCHFTDYESDDEIKQRSVITNMAAKKKAPKKKPSKKC